MAVFLLYLLLVPLALPPVLSQGTYYKFKLQHTFSGNILKSCTRFMKAVYQKYPDMECKHHNTIILGDNGFETNLNDVTNICKQYGGTPKGGNLFESIKEFNVIDCNLESGDYPPNCRIQQGGEEEHNEEEDHRDL
ncbi:hypothetical protein NL108_012702 [Boleophthalmus pectinirostris]|uniref:ribonuclease pancreatic-like n=1 Tax=Boleophthalmus pectinirostris TaxID=150288 RepID=UPI00242DF49E|nr:ribonuclease pancreatic-like [Boleophthalmus pectinirostris]XP_055016598.1 ribonuclease pancreatic-like [Boleophthalmus pectinirostris]KAJ0068866.1 hypothetical protein NL108_012702 [Boleophthalmus pectinirostris]